MRLLIFTPLTTVKSTTMKPTPSATMKNSVIVFCSLLAFAGISQGQTTFFDAFSRADVSPTSDGSDIGPNWVIGSGEFDLAGGPRRGVRVNENTTAMVANSVMWNTTVGLNEGNFTASTSVYSATAGRRGGIAFFVQDSDSFLSFEIRSGFNDWRVSQFDNGTQTTVTSGTLSSGTFTADAPFTLTVSSSAADTFDLSVIDETTSTELVLTSFTDSSLAFNSGFAGVYYELNSGQVRWDDFSVTSVPEPSSVALLTGFAGLSVVLLRRRRR